MHARVGMLIDAQVHAYPEPLRPGLPDMSADGIVATMDELGVDRALLVSPWIPSRDDASYAISSHLRHPDRLRAVAPFDEKVSDLEAKLERWTATPGAAGMRLFIGEAPDPDSISPQAATVARAAARSGQPLCLPAWGRLGYAAALIRRFPDTVFVLDHLALAQPPHAAVPDDPFEGLDEVLAIAALDNVAIKLTGMCTLSRTAFPFADLWEPVGAIIEAYGPQRCMWGTDWTRAYGIVSPEAAVRSFRDHWPGSDDEWKAIAGETAATIYRWPLG